MKILSLLSRAAIGAPFVIMGYAGMTNPGGRVKAAEDFGIPEDFADLAVRANGAAMVLGGAAVITGVLPRLGALAVTAAMIPTTLSVHSFWKDTDPKQRQANQTQFLKNLGMVGGLLAVAAATKPARD